MPQPLRRWPFVCHLSRSGRQGSILAIDLVPWASRHPSLEGTARRKRKCFGDQLVWKVKWMWKWLVISETLPCQVFHFVFQIFHPLSFFQIHSFSGYVTCSRLKAGREHSTRTRSLPQSSHGTVSPSLFDRSAWSLLDFGMAFLLWLSFQPQPPGFERSQWMAPWQDWSRTSGHWSIGGGWRLLHWWEGHVQDLQQAGSPLPSSPQCGGPKGWKDGARHLPIGTFQDPFGAMLTWFGWRSGFASSRRLFWPWRHGRLGGGYPSEEAWIWPMIKVIWEKTPAVHSGHRQFFVCEKDEFFWVLTEIELWYGGKSQLIDACFSYSIWTCLAFAQDCALLQGKETVESNSACDSSAEEKYHIEVWNFVNHDLATKLRRKAASDFALTLGWRHVKTNPVWLCKAFLEAWQLPPCHGTLVEVPLCLLL